MHVFDPCILSLFSVPTMVNLGEIKLHIGVDYGKKTRTGSHITHAQAVAVSPVSEGDKAAHPAFCVHTVCVCLLPSRWFTGELQRVHLPNHETAATWVLSLHFTPALNSSLCFECRCDAQLMPLDFFPIQITSWSTRKMTQSHSSSSLRCPAFLIFLLLMCGMLLFYPAVGPQRSHSALCLSVCLVRLCDDRSSVTSCFSEALTRRSLSHAGKASLLSRSPWKTGWVRKVQQGRRLLSVSLSQWKGDSSMSSFLMQLHGKKQHIRALLIDRVLLQHEVSLTTHLLKSSQLILCTSNNKIICVLLFSVRTFCVFCVSRWGSWWLTAVNIKWFIRSCSVICCCFRPALTAR